MTQSSNRTGERLGSGAANSRYIKHPTTGHLEDGDPLDAGTAHLISNNLNHLAYESCRHIAWDWKSSVTNAKGVGYTGIYDAAAPTGGAVQNWNQISWALDPGSSNTSGCARRYPITLITDAVPTYGNDPTFRWVRCKIRAKSAASNTLKVAVCITPWNTTPRRGEIWAPPSAAVDFWKTVSTTEETVSIDLKPEIQVGGNFQTEYLRCEESAPNPTIVRVYLGWLWFGWYSTNSNDYWRSFSAYEYRESP